MSKLTAAALAALAATGVATTVSPAPALAADRASNSAPVRIQQAATRTVGACNYATVLRGAYLAAPSVPYASVNARAGVVMIDTRVACRGQQPQIASRQVYFAPTTETQLLARISDLARVALATHPGRTCSFAPALARRDDHIDVTDITATCAPTARGGGPRPARAH